MSTQKSNFSSQQITIFVAGLALAVFSLWLARSVHFRHFYELLVIGLSAMLYVANTNTIANSLYPKLYVLFVKAGLIGDLLLGLLVFHLWKYNYEHWWEYITLYVIVYPIAGIVMVQTYLLLVTWFKRFTRSKYRTISVRSFKSIVLLFVTLIVVSTVLVIANITKELQYVLLFASISLLANTLLAYANKRHSQQNFIELSYGQPAVYVGAMLLATYINAFLHELPNVGVYQWEYAHFSIAQDLIYGVPVLVLMFWPLLALLPIAGYYYKAKIPITSKK